MASLGAKFAQVYTDARLNKLTLIRSSFIKKPGTLITKRSNIINSKIVTGYRQLKTGTKVSLFVKDKPGVAQIFKPLSQNLINVDMVVQNISANGRS